MKIILTVTKNKEGRKSIKSSFPAEMKASEAINVLEIHLHAIRSSVLDRCDPRPENDKELAETSKKLTMGEILPFTKYQP